jgi:hypothetical protein
MVLATQNADAAVVNDPAFSDEPVDTFRAEPIAVEYGAFTSV